MYLVLQVIGTLWLLLFVVGLIVFIKNGNQL
jgi:hypothetical protein